MANEHLVPHVGEFSSDRSNRFAIDAAIRRNGFTIYSRSNLRILWEKNGRVYLQREVLEMIDPDHLWEAEYMEKLYDDGYT